MNVKNRKTKMLRFEEVHKDYKEFLIPDYNEVISDRYLSRKIVFNGFPEKRPLKGGK